MHENGQRLQYRKTALVGPEPVHQADLGDAGRLFVLLLPSAQPAEGRATVRSSRPTGLPGGAVSGGPLTAATTTTPVAAAR